MYYAILAYDENGFMWESHFSGRDPSAFESMKESLEKLLPIPFYKRFSVIRARNPEQLVKRLNLCDRKKEE